MTDIDDRDLVQWLRDYLDRHPSITHLSVALDAGYSGNGFVSQVVRGDKSVPLESLGKWIHGLKLMGHNREWFTLLVHLQHTPQWARDQFWRLWDRVQTMEKRELSHQRDLIDVRDRMTALEAELAKARREAASLADELASVRKTGS